MKTRFFSLFFAVAVLLVLMGACGTEPTPPPPTSTPLPPTDTPTPVPTNTPSPTPTDTPTSTPTPTDTPTPTITPNATETQMYTDMLGRVQEYFDKGYISSTNGDYYRLNDFADDGTGDIFPAQGVIQGYGWVFSGYRHGWERVVTSYSVPFWYREKTTGYSVKDFIINADIRWGPNAPAPPAYMGCGFTFHLNGDNQTRLVGYVSPYHTVNMERIATDLAFRIISRHFAEDNPNALEATLTMAVNGANISIFADGDFFWTYTAPPGQAEFSPGDTLAYLIVFNENNKPRCTFSNVELWVVKP